MRFNTSRCSHVQKEEDLLFGNIETICEISVPVLIETKEVLLESKHSYMIQLLLVLSMLGIVIGVFTCFIKCNRNLENRFNSLKQALERAQKGYKNKNAKVPI